MELVLVGLVKLVWSDAVHKTLKYIRSWNSDYDGIQVQEILINVIIDDVRIRWPAMHIDNTVLLVR